MWRDNQKKCNHSNIYYYTSETEKNSVVVCQCLNLKSKKNLWRRGLFEGGSRVRVWEDESEIAGSFLLYTFFINLEYPDYFCCTVAGEAAAVVAAAGCCGCSAGSLSFGGGADPGNAVLCPGMEYCGLNWAKFTPKTPESWP